MYDIEVHPVRQVNKNDHGEMSTDMDSNLHREEIKISAATT